MSTPWFVPGSTRSTYAQHQTRSNDPSFEISQKLTELEITPPPPAGGAYGDVAVEATGSDIPPPVTSFAEMCFPAKALSDNIVRCKYASPTPIQRYAIPVAMAGRDLMACAQTGSGKTAAFCFPIISGIIVDKMKNGGSGESGGDFMACPMALILAPTRELSCQIHEEAKKFSYQTGVKAVVAYGGTPIVQQLRNLERGVDILVATPGRLVDMIERGRVSLKNVKYLALDEADRMLDMGFERDVRRIVQQMEMPPPGVRQTMLFSATFPAEIQRLGSDFLSNYIFLSAGKVGSSTDLIVQRVEYVHDMDKRDHLVNLLRANRTNRNRSKDSLTLVFVETKRGADALEQWLSRKGFPSAAIHGDKFQMERERALRSFRSGATPILVATDVAARGLDIPSVAHVINFDLPKVIDGYVHRIGRTGRAGKSGLATAFFSDKNSGIAKELVQVMEEANQVIPKWLRECAKTTQVNGHRPYRYGNGGGGGAPRVADNYSNNQSYGQYGSNNYDPYCGGAGAPYGGGAPYAMAYGVPYGGVENYGVPYHGGGSSSGYGFNNHGSIVATGWE